jgi:hypothetical protein
MIFPRLNRVLMLGVFDEMTNALPTIALAGFHRRPIPVGVCYFSPLKNSGNLIMPLLEDVG